MSLHGCGLDRGWQRRDVTSVGFALGYSAVAQVLSEHLLVELSC